MIASFFLVDAFSFHCPSLRDYLVRSFLKSFLKKKKKNTFDFQFFILKNIKKNIKFKNKNNFQIT